MKIRKSNKLYVILGVLLFCVFFNIANVSTDNGDVGYVTAASSCKHPYYVRYGDTYYEREDYTNNSTKCYKTRTWRKQKCGECGYRNIPPSYSEWKVYKHDYGFLGLRSTCKECGRKKK